MFDNDSGYKVMPQDQAPPALNTSGAFLHTLTDEDKHILVELTKSMHRLASAIEEQNKQPQPVQRRSVLMGG